MEIVGLGNFFIETVLNTKHHLKSLACAQSIIAQAVWLEICD